jgi:hypothetical protein
MQTGLLHISVCGGGGGSDVEAGGMAAIEVSMIN